jgi:hypothetical protein
MYLLGKHSAFTNLMNLSPIAYLTGVILDRMVPLQTAYEFAHK